MEDALDKDSDLDIPAPAYSAARSRRQADGSNGRLMLIAGGVVSVMVTLGAIWGFSGRHAGAIPVIEADRRPIRVKPDNPGGLQVAAANEAILSGDAASQSEALAGPPETPDPLALRAQQQAQAASTAPPPLIPASISPPTLPAPIPAPAISAAPLQRPVEPRHAAAAPAHPTTRVQLAALTSETAAKTEWDRLSRRMPDLLEGRQPQVVRTERDGRVFWRLRTGGFADTAEASAFCERVRAKGTGCSVASF